MRRVKVPTYTDFYGDRLNNIEVDTVTLLNRVTVEVDPLQRHMVASSRKYSSFWIPTNFHGDGLHNIEVDAVERRVVAK